MIVIEASAMVDALVGDPTNPNCSLCWPMRNWLKFSHPAPELSLCRHRVSTHSEVRT